MHLEEFLLATVILLAVTTVAVAVFKRLGLGSILGFLAAGVVLGPSGIAITTEVAELRHFTELGVVLLMFIIGLEMHPTKLWAMRRMVFGLGSLQVLVTGLAIAGYAALRGLPWNTDLIVGFGLALSSTAFVLQILGERGDMATDHGNATFAILLLQDLAIVPLLALVPVLSDQPVAGTQGVFWQEALMVAGLVVGVILVGRYLIPLLLTHSARTRNMEAFFLISMLAVLGAALAMDAVGASMALGAFLMGMTLSDSDYSHQIEASVEPFKGVLLALFFIAVGMSIDLNTVKAEGFELAVNVMVILVIKAVVLFGLSLLFGLKRSAAVRVAFLLPQCGEFGFVLFGAALAVGILPPEVFALAILVISTSMALTPLLVKVGDLIAERLTDQSTETSVGDALPVPVDRQVVVAGYGRGGRALALMLERSDVPYVAIDKSVERIRLGKKAGHNVHYGDMTDPQIIEASGVGKASAVAVMLDDHHAVQRLVSTIVNFHPDVPIYARAGDFERSDELRQIGVAHVIPSHAESSLALGSALLHDIGITHDDIDNLIIDLRRDNYGPLASGTAKG